MLNTSKREIFHLAGAVLLLVSAGAHPLAAQTEGSAQIATPVIKPRAQASRAELVATLAEIDKVLASSGYSGRLKSTRRQEGELIRARLADGDFKVGDQITLTVAQEPALNKVFAVSPGPVLVLPGMKDIPLAGVLRSETQTYLTEQIGKYVRSPEVTAEPMIRLSVFGAIGKPGYFQMSADLLASDAIMSAGGPNTPDAPKKTVIRRGNREIVSREVFQVALREGLTLDQLNLQAGDEIYVGGKTKGVSILPIFGAFSGIISSIYFLRYIVHL